MKFRKLCMLGLSSVVILSACNISIDSKDKESNDKTQSTDKQSNDKATANHQDETNVTEAPNEANNYNGEPITVDEAKSIAFNNTDSLHFTDNKDDLIYNENQSNEQKIFIETPFTGINQSVKHYAIIDIYIGSIIDTGSAVTSPEGLIEAENGYIDKDFYNTTAEFYNIFVYQEGMPVFKMATSNVPAQTYKELLDLVNDYHETELGHYTRSNQTSSTNNPSQSTEARPQTNSENNNSTNERTSNEPHQNTNESNQETQTAPLKEDNNDTSTKAQQENQNQPSNDEPQSQSTTEESNTSNDNNSIDNRSDETEPQEATQTDDVESNDNETSNNS